MPKATVPPIDSGRLRLRLLEEADLDMTLRWRNQDHIRIWFKTSDIIPPEQHRAWFERYRHRDDDFVFIIEERLAQWKPVGQVSLYNIDWRSRTAEFGRLMIGESCARGKGIGKEAVQVLINFSFYVLGIEKIELEVLCENKPAFRLYESCGFVRKSSERNLIVMELVK